MILSFFLAQEQVTGTLPLMVVYNSHIDYGCAPRILSFFLAQAMSFSVAAFSSGDVYISGYSYFSNLQQRSGRLSTGVQQGGSYRWLRREKPHEETRGREDERTWKHLRTYRPMDMQRSFWPRKRMSTPGSAEISSMFAMHEAVSTLKRGD